MRLPPKLLSTSFPSVQTSDEATAAQIQLLAALFGAKAMKREWWQLLPNKKAMQLLIFVRSDPSVEFPVCRISFFFQNSEPQRLQNNECRKPRKFASPRRVVGKGDQV